MDLWAQIVLPVVTAAVGWFGNAWKYRSDRAQKEAELDQKDDELAQTRQRDADERLRAQEERELELIDKARDLSQGLPRGTMTVRTAPTQLARSTAATPAREGTMAEKIRVITVTGARSDRSGQLERDRLMNRPSDPAVVRIANAQRSAEVRVPLQLNESNEPVAARTIGPIDGLMPGL